MNNIEKYTNTKAALIGKTVMSAEMSADVNGYAVRIRFTDGTVFDYSASGDGYSCWSVERNGRKRASMRRSMKTLEELGISPAPWSNTVGGTEKPFETNSVWDAMNGGILTGGYAESLNDARLIAAAPELYEALAALLNCSEREAPFTRESGMSIAMDMARKAIEKAGGEE